MRYLAHQLPLHRLRRSRGNALRREPRALEFLTVCSTLARWVRNKLTDAIVLGVEYGPDFLIDGAGCFVADFAVCVARYIKKLAAATVERLKTERLRHAKFAAHPS